MLDMSLLEEYIKNKPEQCEQILETVARRIEAKAKENASGVPPGPGVITGTLMNSIMVTTPQQGERDIGPTVDYGPDVELGTSHNRAYPFLYPAYQSEAPSIIPEARRVFKEV